MKTEDKLLGCILLIDQIFYRVIHMTGISVVLCELNTTKLKLLYFPLDEIINNDKIIETFEEPYIIDYSLMSAKETKGFEKRKEVIDKISEMYGPSYMGLMSRDKKELLIEIQKELNISNVTLWTWIRKYIQSGMNYNSLVDERYHYKEHKDYEYTKKTGRPTKYKTASGVPLTDKVLEHFKEGLDIIKSGRYRTIKYGYNSIMEKYYSYPPSGNDKAVKLYPESMRPTFNQFYYYCKKNYSIYQKEIVKTSKMEVNNNKRLKFGSSRSEAYKPGVICEVDANEVDISIVSELDPTQSVGRPIIYVMIDNCTSMIVAVSVSFENNSFIGITNLMLNLAEDKVEFAKRHGIDIEPQMWRSCFIPDTIRCDRGSEFASDKFGKVCDNLKIKRDLVPPGTGSMKGVIEEYFHEFQLSIKPYIERKGLITKRHDSKHHKEAMLTMTDFTKLLINNVITHNQKVLLNYFPTKEMLKIKKFTTTPIMLWDYFCDKCSEPTYITDATKVQYFFNVMLEKTAKISSVGIRLENLVYINENDPKLRELMFEAGSIKKNFKVRIDPRTVNEIYYMRNEKLYIAELNPDLPNIIAYKNLTWLQYNEYNTKRKDIRNDGKKINEVLDFQEHQLKNFIINNIKRNSYANDKNINESRRKEKDRTNFENRISTKLPINDSTKVILASKAKAVIEQNEKDEDIKDTTNIQNANKDNIIDKEDDFEPSEDLRAALREHENRERRL